MGKSKLLAFTVAAAVSAAMFAGCSQTDDTDSSANSLNSLPNDDKIITSAENNVSAAETDGGQPAEITETPAENFEYSYSEALGGIEITDYIGNVIDVVIPEKIDEKPVKSIGFKAFMNCKEIESVTIPDSVVIMDVFSFAYCDKLKTINIPDSVETIGSWAITGCNSLEEITVPEGVECIEEHLFYNSRNLKSVTIPDSVKSIKERAFWECRGLESLTVPDSVETIAKGAFDGCKVLTVTYKGGSYTIDNFDEIYSE